jgi:hypothetical protein
MGESTPPYSRRCSVCLRLYARHVLIAGWFQTYFEHVLTGHGYQFWSGIGSDVGELTLLTAFVLWLRQRNCHVYRCWRLSWHPHPGHGHPVCKHHHPDSRRIQ